MMLGEGVIKDGLKDYDDGRKTVKVHGLKVFLNINPSEIDQISWANYPKARPGRGGG